MSQSDGHLELVDVFGLHIGFVKHGHRFDELGSILKRGKNAGPHMDRQHVIQHILHKTNKNCKAGERSAIKLRL